MTNIESLNAAKFQKFKMLEVKETSKIYGGRASVTQIATSGGTNWDAVTVLNTNFYTDGGTVLGPTYGETNTIPLHVQQWINAH